MPSHLLVGRKVYMPTGLRTFDMPMPNGEKFVVEVSQGDAYGMGMPGVTMCIGDPPDTRRLPTADEWRDARRHVMGFLDKCFKEPVELAMESAGGVVVDINSDEFKNSPQAKSNEQSWPKS